MASHPGRFQSESTGATPLSSLKPWLDEIALTALPKSPLGEAVTYARNQWAALQVYTTDGALSIDNNIAENAIRPLALGRKNFLFVGSPRGGKACAMALTFLQSAKAVGANPYEYLHDIYNRIMDHPVNRLHELLPAAWMLTRANR